MPGLVLAAGASSRMGRPKALLMTPAGVTFVSHLVRTLQGATVHPLIVVTRQALLAEVRDEAHQACVIVNPEPDRGQLSSLLVGFAELGAAPAVLVALVDAPLVGVETVRGLVGLWERTRAPLVRPMCHGRHGHPVIFGAEAIAALQLTDLQAGAKPVVRQFTGRQAVLPVTDLGVLIDVDTPDEYDRLHSS
jgi:molybdenum cofactor cytidylyltransferase